MSTVVWDGRTLAADSQATSNGLARKTTKIWANSIRIWAIVGMESHFTELTKWLDAGCDPNNWPSFQTTEDFSVLIVVRRKSNWQGMANAFGAFDVFVYEQRPYPIKLDSAPFMAWGSGRELALGALAAKSSAIDALITACTYDIYSDLPIKHFDGTSLRV